MTSQSLDELNRRFAVPTALSFVQGNGGLTVARFNNETASAEVYLYGAQVTHFQPKGQAPVLFLSPKSLFTEGKAIRGGVPICWPWFANKHDEPNAPFHGFARTSTWSVESTSASSIVLQLESSDATRKIWPFDFVARYTVSIGNSLSIALEIHNRSAQKFDYTEALHTYFKVANVRDVTLAGVTGGKFFDKTDNQEKVEARNPLPFGGETNSIYFGTKSTCVINDPGLHRKIKIEKTGSESTVVWNPWSEGGAKMADIGAENWSSFLCVETANTIYAPVVLAPGETHTTSATISVE